jgi:methionyl-tRNA formyltransferase
MFATLAWRCADSIARFAVIQKRVIIMEVVPALDGAVVSKGVVPITDTDTTQSLHTFGETGAKPMVAMQTLTQTGAPTPHQR